MDEMLLSPALSIKQQIQAVSERRWSCSLEGPNDLSRHG